MDVQVQPADYFTKQLQEEKANEHGGEPDRELLTE